MNTDTKARPDRGPVIGGVVFIVIGTVLLLEKLGYLPWGFAIHFWPMIFVVIGIVKIVYAGGRPTGAALIALGAFLQLHEMGIIHASFQQLWPVFLIIAGGAMLWQAMGGEAGRVQRPAIRLGIYLRWRRTTNQYKEFQRWEAFCDVWRLQN